MVNTVHLNIESTYRGNNVELQRLTTLVTTHMILPTARDIDKRNLTTTPPKEGEGKSEVMKSGGFHILVFLSIFNGEGINHIKEV